MNYEIPIFKPPQHLEDLSDFDKNLKRILDLYPKDIATEEGGWIYDFSAPIAAIEEEIAVYHLPQIIKQMFVFWAEGEYLDYQAFVRRLTRNKATHAQGFVEITTSKEVTIPKGFIFATAATDYNFAQGYVALEETTIKDKGQVRVQAIIAGKKGNTAEDTVIIQEKPLSSISKVTNPKPIEGGVEKEDDDHLRQRLIDYDWNAHKSYIGNVFDYKMWAMDVDGVGTADVVAATKNDGVVTIILTDANNDPANPDLIKKVEKHIMGEHPNDMKRLAPVNAKLKIIPVELLEITIQAKIKLEPGHSFEIIKNTFTEKLEEYFKEAKVERVVRYSEVGGALIDTPGVDDYHELTVNGGSVNVELSQLQMPRIKGVLLDVI